MAQRKADDLTHTDSLDLYPRQAKRSPMPQRPHRENALDKLERGVSVNAHAVEKAEEREDERKALNRERRDSGGSGRLTRQRSKAEQAGGAGLIVAVIVVVVVWLLLQSGGDDSSGAHRGGGGGGGGNAHHVCVSPCAAGVCRCGYEGQG